jgi:hypothetical protein
MHPMHNPLRIVQTNHPTRTATSATATRATALRSAAVKGPEPAAVGSWVVTHRVYVRLGLTLGNGRPTALVVWGGVLYPTRRQRRSRLRRGLRLVPN